jgi:predicted Zn-dependent protease
VLAVFDTLAETESNEAGFLVRAGFAHSMGHNLDFEGSAKKADSLFRRLLRLHPKHPRGNYFYGMLLAGTRTRAFEGIPFLERALSLGEENASYTLGLLYVQKGDREKGLSFLRRYSKRNPDDAHAIRMIRAVEEDRVQFKLN